MRAENAEVLSCFETREELQTLAISIPSLSTIPPIHDSLDPLSRIGLRRLFAEKSFSELNKFTQKITKSWCERSALVPSVDTLRLLLGTP